MLVTGFYEILAHSSLYWWKSLCEYILLMKSVIIQIKNILLSLLSVSVCLFCLLLFCCCCCCFFVLLPFLPAALSFLPTPTKAACLSPSCSSQQLLYRGALNEHLQTFLIKYERLNWHIVSAIVCPLNWCYLLIKAHCLWKPREPQL